MSSPGHFQTHEPEKLHGALFTGKALHGSVLLRPIQGAIQGGGHTRRCSWISSLRCCWGVRTGAPQRGRLPLEVATCRIEKKSVMPTGRWRKVAAGLESYQHASSCLVHFKSARVCCGPCGELGDTLRIYFPRAIKNERRGLPPALTRAAAARHTHNGAGSGDPPGHSGAFSSHCL